MSALSKHWEQMAGRYVALSRRERALVALALLLGPLLIANSLLLEPLAARQKSLQSALAVQRTTLAEMQGQVTSLQQQLQVDPDAARLTELKTLQAERIYLDDQIRQIGGSFVRPDEMNGLLESLLSRQPGLRLVSLKTLVPQSLRPQADGDVAAEAKAPGFDLLRHGVEIRIEGSYEDLQAYLLHLEKLNAKVLWGGLKYQVLAYPKAEMTLTLYTLSTDSAWLSL